MSPEFQIQYLPLQPFRDDKWGGLSKTLLQGKKNCQILDPLNITMTKTPPDLRSQSDSHLVCQEQDGDVPALGVHILLPDLDVVHGLPPGDVKHDDTGLCKGSV